MTKEDFKMATAIWPSGGVSPLHHFGDEAGDGGGGLIWVQLSKQVADIVCCASLFPCDESKKPGRMEEKYPAVRMHLYFAVIQQHNNVKIG